MSSLQTVQLLIGLLVAGCLCTACDRGPVSPAPVRTVEVFATVFPLADVAREVGGEVVNVQWIVETGQSVSGVQNSSELRNRMRGCDIVISGGITERWATEGFSDPFQAQRILRLDLLQSAREGPASSGLLWLDPIIVRDAARELCARLIILRPEREMYFRERTDAFAARLDALVQEYHQKLATAQNRRLLVLSPDFNPLLLRFGFDPIQPLEASATALSGPDLSALKRSAGQRNTRLLVVPSDTPAVVERDLEVGGGLQIVRIDALGSSAAGGRNGYLQILQFDLENLLQATTIR